jgi:Glycoside-hydrolase family GH114
LAGGLPHNSPMSPSGRSRLALALLASCAAACGESRGTLVTSAVPRWQPVSGLSWQVQLSGGLDASVDASLYDVDLFDTSAEQIATLHAAGRRVACYVSVGTLEPWRADAASFPAVAVGQPLADYPTEHWLDTRSATVRALMAARLDVAVTKTCDGLELSNVSPGGVDSGFALAPADVVAYGDFLAAAAHTRGLGVGLGAASDVAASLEPSFDYAFAYGCLADATCGAYAGFVAAQKVVFGVEFGGTGDAGAICPRAAQAGLDALIKDQTLDAFRVPCR